MKRLTLNIPADLHNELKALAAQRGLSLSDFVKSALFDLLFEIRNERPSR